MSISSVSTFSESPEDEADPIFSSRADSWLSFSESGWGFLVVDFCFGPIFFAGFKGLSDFGGGLVAGRGLRGIRVMCDTLEAA